MSEEIKMRVPYPGAAIEDAAEANVGNKKKRPSVAEVRKSFIRGKVTQRPLNFKCDLDNFEKLKGVKNKGRLINELLRNYFEDTEDLPL